MIQARVFRLRDALLAKTMEPLRAFDELMLYQLSKASSTAQFLERCAGLSPAEAQATVILARKLKAMPLTEAAWLAGTITSGQVRAIAAIVTKRLAERYTADEAEVLRDHRAARRQRNRPGHATVGQLHRSLARRRPGQAAAGGRVLPFRDRWPLFLQRILRRRHRRGDRQGHRTRGDRQPPRQRHPQPRRAPRRSPRRCVRVLRRLP